MTVELLDQDTPAAVAFFLAWMLPMTGDPVDPTALGMRRPDANIAPLPFWMVNVVVETDDPDCGYSDGVVSMHYFDTSDTLALRGSRLMHRRMLYLARNPLTDITIDGQVANLDYLTTVEKPRWQDYGDDKVSRFVGRYGYGLSFVAAP